MLNHTHNLDKGQETARKEFEEWSRSKWTGCGYEQWDGAGFHKEGNYINSNVQVMWIAWKAATAKADERITELKAQDDE